MSENPGQRTNVVVLEGGRLTLCEQGSSEERQLELGECLDMMHAVETPAAVETSSGGSSSLPWTDRPDGRIEPAAPCAALAGGGALHAYSDALGRWFALREPHIRVVAATWYASTVDELAERSGLDAPSVAAVVGDLCAIGVVRPSSAVPAPDPAEEPPASSTGSDSFGDRAPDRRKIEPTTSASPDGSHRIPVYSFWATHSGPHLGSAAVVAYARVCDGGHLNDHYDLRRTAPADQVLEEIRARSGPAILLCSNYIWSVEANLEVARAAIEANPGVVVVHGGPSTPRYPEDGERFLRGLDGDHVLVNGEGELTFAELLDVMADATADDGRSLDLAAIGGVEGIQFLDRASGHVVRTPQRDRHDHLEDFPSALVSGELDDVDIEILRKVPLSIETNRGCPYSCTFCDWGQNTMSRIRKFPVERALAEFAWLARHGIEQWIVADANFGILPRDLDITDAIVRFKNASDYPKWILVAPPKNATPRFVEIIDRLLDAGLSMKAALALQTRDEATLETIRRSNIGTASYDRLAVELRRRGLPLTSDLMMGLPGATVASFMADLQWSIDEQVRAYLWPTFVLPNSPMNDPEYRSEHGIRTTKDLVVRTATYSADERILMDRYAYGYQVLEVLGVMRHLLRFLQWEHGIAATDAIARVVDLTDARPDRYPLTNWMLHHMDVFLTPPVGWRPLYRELHRLLVDEMGIPDRSDLRTVLEVNEFLMPSPNRAVPDEIELAHDYGGYFRTAQDRLLADEPTEPSAPLHTFGPGKVHILADPDDICSSGLRRLAEGRVPSGYVGDFSVVAHMELLTSVATYLPFSFEFLTRVRADDTEATPADPAGRPRRRSRRRRGFGPRRRWLGSGADRYVESAGLAAARGESRPTFHEDIMATRQERLIQAIEFNNRLIAPGQSDAPNPRPLDQPWYTDLLEAGAEMTAEWDAFVAGGWRLPLIEDLLGAPQENTSSWWKAGMLFASRKPFEPLAQHFPRTVEAMLTVPGCRGAMLSILGPGGKRPPHAGCNSGTLRFLWGLRCPEGSGLSLEGTKIPFPTGTGLLFDDTAVHATWNGSDEPRAVVLCDLIRPLEGKVRSAHNATFQRAVHLLTPEYRSSVTSGREAHEALNDELLRVALSTTPPRHATTPPATSGGHG